MRPAGGRAGELAMVLRAHQLLYLRCLAPTLKTCTWLDPVAQSPAGGQAERSGGPARGAILGVSRRLQRAPAARAGPRHAHRGDGCGRWRRAKVQNDSADEQDAGTRCPPRPAVLLRHRFPAAGPRFLKKVHSQFGQLSAVPAWYKGGYNTVLRRRGALTSP